MKKIPILGIPFNAFTVDETLETLLTYIEEPKNHIIVTPNPEGVMQAQRNPAFKEALVSADLCLPDGAGIVLASRILGMPMGNRVRGYDTAMALLSRLNKKRGATAYLLGCAPGVIEKAADALCKKYPNIKVAGFHHGFFTDEQMVTILDEIERLAPELLFVCTGMPKAEIWAHTHRYLPARLTLCLGGTLDIMAGHVQLAPTWLRKIGLEWLYRLICQPQRWRRQLDLPRFVIAVIRSKKHFTKNKG